MSFYPNFRAKFIRANAWGSDAPAPGSSELVVKMSTPQGGASGFCKPLVLPQLDLNTVGGKDEPPVSESIMKRNKLALFEKQCSQVCEGLYVSGEYVAKSRETLRAHGITHVVNCVGAMYPEYFRSDGIQYRTLWLQDSPSEDILCVLYDTFDFIDRARRGSEAVCAQRDRGQQQQGERQRREERQQRAASRDGSPGPAELEGGTGDGCGGRGAGGPAPARPADASGEPSASQLSARSTTGGLSGRAGSAAPAEGAAAAAGAGGGRVLVHCSQGVSRSTTIAIAYLMWKMGQPYDEVYQAVRALRGVTSPNIGFTCQLLQWQKRRSRPPSRVRVYRVAPHTAESPLYLVPRAVGPQPGCVHPDWRCLDPRGCFLIHLPGKLFVWRGADCLSTMLDGGLRCAAQLGTYEGAAAPEVVYQGEEPDELVAALSPDATGSQAGGSGAGDISLEPSCASLGGGGGGGGGGGITTRPSARAGEPLSPAASLPVSAGASRPPSARVGYTGTGSGGGGQRLPAAQQLSQQGIGSSGGGGGSGGGDGGGGSAFGCEATADMLGEQLSQQQLSSRTIRVSQVDAYTPEFQWFFRALRAAGGADAAGAGRLTPRSSALLLSRDDSAAGGPRPDSPATVEGRSRKYRRSSESERWSAAGGASRLGSAGSGAWWGPGPALAQGGQAGGGGGGDAGPAGDTLN